MAIGDFRQPSPVNSGPSAISVFLGFHMFPFFFLGKNVGSYHPFCPSDRGEALSDGVFGGAFFQGLSTLFPIHCGRVPLSRVFKTSSSSDI